MTPRPLIHANLALLPNVLRNVVVAIYIIICSQGFLLFNFVLDSLFQLICWVFPLELSDYLVLIRNRCCLCMKSFVILRFFINKNARVFSL